MGGSVDNSVLQTVLTLAQPFIEFIKYQLPKAGLYALIASPAIIVWLFLAFSKTEKSRKVLLLVFGLGCLTAPFLLYVQYLWDLFPQFNLSYFIESNITSPNKQFIAMFILFAAMEEIVKMYVIRKIDEKTLLIDTLGNAIRYSTASALGFSFVENVYYLYQFGPTASTGDLITMYFFRSIFTTCAHMIFSGIFGYHYGIGKFSIDITKQQTISGERSKISGIIGKIFNLPTSQAYQQKMILKGLFLAVSIHATYNYLLQFNLIIPVVIFVILGYLYLRYLLSRKAGHLILTTDISEKKRSTLAKKDEDVVVELLGMWFNDKKYVDVIHICERLLERDPDNNVVKLFKAKAMDKMNEKDTYKNILGSVIKTKDDLSSSDKNIISKYTAEKEMLGKIKEAVKEELKKEGKEFKVEQNPQEEEQTQGPPPKDVLSKYTTGKEFKL